MNTTEQKQETLIGQKTMLLPFAEYDLGNFVRLHRADKENNMGRFCLKDYSDEQAIFYITGLLNKSEIFVWTVYTQDDDPKFVGFIYLSNVSNYMLSLHGIMDKEFSKTSRKENKKLDMKCAEDAAQVLIKYCFDKGVNRIETDVCQSNRKAVSFVKRAGFIQEGILRNVVIKDKGFENLIIFSILKDDWK